MSLDYEAQRSMGNLALALSKAQGMLKGATKDSQNPHFKSKYADLASVWDACREALAKNEIAVIQPLSGGPDTITVTTILVHKSGEFIESSLTIRPTKADAQGLGSAATYGRRYGLASMVGVAPEDDDGNAASAPQKAEAAAVRAAEAQKPTFSLEYPEGEVKTFSDRSSLVTQMETDLQSMEPAEQIAHFDRNATLLQTIQADAAALKNAKGKAIVDRIGAIFRHIHDLTKE